MVSAEKIRYYYKLTKPGIVRGNSLSVLSGFLMASQGVIDWWLLFYTLIASALVMGGGCVLNNFIDRDIDAKMARTKSRGLVNERISARVALIYGGALSVLGFAILYSETNLKAVYVGIFGFVFYVYVYGYFKRISEHGTLVGSIAGAIPPLVGYLAVANNFDAGAYIVFLILVFWQLPHFYAIAIFRAKDYKNAGIPVLSLTRGTKTTRTYILFYLFIYMVVSVMPYFFGLVNIGYLIIVISANTYWLVNILRNYSLPDNKWAGKVFGSSLIALSAFALATLVGTMI